MKKSAVIYARYSSEKQNEQSIEGQLSVCYKFAENNDYEILEEYIDRATTGTNDNRAEFQRMLENSSKKMWQYVIVYKGDRFARNRIESAINKKKLKDNGVKVVSATENIPDTPEGIILESLLEGMAEYYSAELSQKVKRGMAELVKKKMFLGGHTPLGYNIIDKKYYINEQEAEIIRYVFEEYAKGKSKKEIVNYLNLHNYRTRTGKKFTIHSFGDLLKNKRYMGCLEFRGEIVEDYCPAIISKETFEMVQAKLAENKHYSAKRKAEEKFILSGHLYCGYCGDTIVGISGTSRTGDRHSYYVCSNRYKRHSCNKKNMVKSTLEQNIIDLTIKRVKMDNKKICDNIYELIQQTTDNGALIDYENKIKDVDTQLDELFEQFTRTKNEELIDRLNKKVSDLSELKKVYQAELRKLQLLTKSNITKKEISDYIKKYIDLGNSNNIEDKQRFVDTFIDCVYVTDDNYTIYIRTDKNSDEKIELSNYNEDVDFILQNSQLDNGSYNKGLGQPNETIVEHNYGFFFTFISLFDIINNMETKKYCISKGNNLGQELNVGYLNSFYYRHTLQEVFTDPSIIGEALLTVNYFPILKQNKEYQKWEMSDEGEEATPAERQQRILAILPKEMIEKINDYISNKKQKYQQALSRIERLYKDSVQTENVLPIEFDGDFALMEDRKVLLHNIPMPSSVEEIAGRKDLGFLASEWFGKLEPFAETRFCSSFFKSSGLQPKEISDTGRAKPQLTFIFDAECKDLKPLLRLDLFQYSRNKQNNNLSKYKPEEIELLESLLEWNTSNGYAAAKQPTWAAIPGGVSSKYVIGIIANNIEENSKEMEIAIQVAEQFGVPLLRPDLTAITGVDLSL